MCGIFAVWNARKAAELTVVGLHGQQHRAIDYAGIVSSDGQYMYAVRKEGVARKAFSKEDLDTLHGRHAVGHIRYPTVDDDPSRENIQPVSGMYRTSEFAVAHNGNLTNSEELGKLFPHRKTSMDTEFVAHLLMSAEGDSLEENLKTALKQLRGSFCLAILFQETLIAVRDPRGVHPLFVGQSGDSFFVSSEDCAFTNVGAKKLFEVEPGTLVWIDAKGVRQVRFDTAEHKRCVFEGIYFAHPASSLNGVSVLEFRKKLGAALEESCPAVADVVVPIPDSAEFHARGYASSGRSGVFEKAIMRSHYVGRTFIAATQAMRDEEVSGKFTFSAPHIEGKCIVLIDDSIVRGTTMRKVIKTLRDLGAKEVHVRIASPPIKHLCTYGIYMKGGDGRLIATNKSEKEIEQVLGADSLRYIPLDVLKQVWKDSGGACFACMDGQFW